MRMSPETEYYLTGFPYEMPPRGRRLNFLETDDDTILNALILAPDANLDEAIVSLFEGVSPFLAENGLIILTGTEFAVIV